MQRLSISRRVLLVDDDELAQRVLARGLTRHGFDVATASSLAAARDHLATTPVDVCLLDIQLGGEWGPSLIDALHAVTARIVVLSGHLSVSLTRYLFVKCRVSDVLLKPCTLDDVAAALEAPAPDAEIPVSREHRLTLSELEREHIHQALIEVQGNISRAARQLGMHRQSLQRKLRKQAVRR